MLTCALYILSEVSCFLFFFQAEDGIRDLYVTGVQTCALPILVRSGSAPAWRSGGRRLAGSGKTSTPPASSRIALTSEATPALYAPGAGALPDGRVAVLPRAGLLQLRGQGDQGGLVPHPAGQHHADRQAVVTPVQRHVHGGLAGHVVERGKRGEQLLALEVLRRAHLVEPADGPWGHGQRGREDGVVGVQRDERQKLFTPF